MANYPTTAFSPTTKNAGDTIAASHVNDLQAEVTAIETALLTSGLAHAVTIINQIGGVALTLLGDSSTNTSLLDLKSNNSGTLYGRLSATPTLVTLLADGTRSLSLGAGGTIYLTVSTTGVVRFTGYTGATFVAGDKYLVVDATGVIHVSALGPAS